MTVRYRVTHRTTYTYRQPVSVCHNLFHLRPRECADQRCEGTTLTVDPEPAVLVDRTDAFGNPMTFAIVQQVHRALAVEAVSEVERKTSEPAEAISSPAWEAVRDAIRAGRSPDALERYHLTLDSAMARGARALREYVEPSFPPGRPLLEAARELSARIHRDLSYGPGTTTVETTPAETLALRRGVCQDFAHLAIACLRTLGLAARYVSGYLITRRSAAADGRALRGADASHAWLSVWTGTGWVDLDPTNHGIADDRHITVAWGRDYADVSPIKGVILGGGEHAIAVEVAVVPL